MGKPWRFSHFRKTNGYANLLLDGGDGIFYLIVGNPMRRDKVMHHLQFFVVVLGMPVVIAVLQPAEVP